MVVAAEVASADAGQAWEAVQWTEARQIETLIGHDPDTRSGPEVGVVDGYQALRDAGALSTAVAYLSHALPRREAVAWAARVLEDAARTEPPPPRARHALDVALRWIGDPSDRHRRAARDAAEGIGNPVAEQFLGKAVFYSGGSIGPAAAPPVMAPGHVAGRYVAAALGQLANRSADPEVVLRRSLDLGEQVARRGLDALAR
jgi:hypothetical protein